MNGCRRGDGEFSRRIHDAVERASLEVQSGSSSDEDEEGSGAESGVSTSSTSLGTIPSQQREAEPKTIPTVSNPNSVYRVGCRPNVTTSEMSKLGSFKFLLLPTVQRVFSRRSSDLAEGEAEGLRWRSVPPSRSLSRRSKLSVFEPEELQSLSAHFHLHGASGGQVPLGQQVPILVRAEPPICSGCLVPDRIKAPKTVEVENSPRSDNICVV